MFRILHWKCAFSVVLIFNGREDNGHVSQSFPYLLQVLLVLVPMTLPHVSLLCFEISEGDEALKTL